ncbi:MAG: hypothetical protein K2L13_03005, partial [Opitutales bacterium]|nr:hypothetical protein [Opitutales bacterium]
TSRLGRWISEYGVNAANRTACEIGKQFDPYTRGEYDQYLVKRAVKAWEESYKVLCNACTFSRWIGWAYFKFMFQFGNKLKELLKLSNPEEAIKKGMPPEEFFTWQNILSFEKKEIDIVNNTGNTTDKLQLSYNPEGGLTANIIDSQNSTTPVKITTISSVKSDDKLFCLRTENGRKIFVKKIDLLTIGLNLKGKVPLGQFFKDNKIPSFEDRAIISNEGKLIKLSYDANSTSENDGISLYTLTPDFFMDYSFSKLNVNFLENGDVCLFRDRNKVATFKMRDLHNLVNQLRKTETSNNSEQKEVPINQFFRKQNAAPRWWNGLYIKLNQSNDSQFSSVLITRYGDSCVNLMMTASSGQKFFTQNVKIKDDPSSDVVEISGQYWDKNEKGWKNFNNVTVNQAQLLQCKRGDKTAPNRSAKIKLVNFLWRNDAFPPGNQTRTLTAIQLGVPDKKNHNQEVQIEIDHSGNAHVGDKILSHICIYRDESCSKGEAIIRGHDENWSYSKYKINLNDLLKKGDNK